MAETKKLTKKDYFSTIREIVKDNVDLVAFIDHEIELLNKKNSNSGQTKVQKENELIMDTIVDELAKINKPVTITDLQNVSEIMASYSNQKLSALLKKLTENNRVVRIVDKKKTYFSVSA